MGGRWRVRAVRQHLGKWDSWLLAGAVDGWVALQEALDDDAAAQARALIDDPQPLLEALGRHPSTFLHGDLYEPNLARSGDHLIAVDWQLAMHSVATIDLARLHPDRGAVDQAVPGVDSERVRRRGLGGETHASGERRQRADPKRRPRLSRLDGRWAAPRFRRPVQYSDPPHRTLHG